MTILPLHPADNASPEALRSFLEQCRAAAVRAARPKLVSISLAVDALDPLAVLESIFEPTEPHFYAERPAAATAVAGAEVAIAFESRGPARFAEVQRWIDETLEHTIAVGDVDAPFGGPHFFAGFTFDADVEPSADFPPAYVFVPRWQVALAGETTTAVANLLVMPDANLDPLVERVWRAHAKFRRFEYGRPEDAEDPASDGTVPSGTGVPPVSIQSGTGILPVQNMGETPMPRQNMGGTPMPLQSGQPHVPPLGRVQVREGACLPHWTSDGAVYAVTFRLADSLPADVVERLRTERNEIELRAGEMGRQMSTYERERLMQLVSEKVERVLDESRGACFLRRDDVAAAVANALTHFDGARYRLHEWCVMPNHVHVVVQPFAGHSLDAILHSWKSFTAKEANRLIGRSGQFWQEEYYDHLIRNEDEYARTVDYIRGNPERAGLAHWQWRGTGVPPVSIQSGTGILPVQNMGETPMPRQNMGGTPMPRQINTGGRTFRISEVGDYRSAVAQAVRQIEAGAFKKIVLARAQDVVADQPFHPLEMLNGLRQRFPDCYAFSFTQGGGRSFIGATPERLVRVSKGVLETEALAGSTRRGASATEDAALGAGLLRSDKDVREQRQVLDDIVARLTPLGLTPEFPAHPQVRRLANVQHLQTPIRANLPQGVHALDVVAALYPTPAVGGNPRAVAVPRIRELEGFPRGLYAGALGWLNARGGGEFFVGIRSALVEGSRARVFAGAGIVAGSTPEKEFAETELKFRAMLGAFRGE